MKFKCIPNETIKMDDKVLGKADADGVLVVEEKTVMDMFLARMKRAHKYLIPDDVVELEQVSENTMTATPKKPRAKK